MKNWLLAVTLSVFAQPALAASVYTQTFDYSDDPLLLFGASQAALNVDFGHSFDSIDFLVIELSFVDDLFDAGEKIGYSVNLGTGGASGSIAENTTGAALSELSFSSSAQNGCTLCEAGVFLDGEGFIRVRADMRLPSRAYVDTIDVSIIGVASVPIPAGAWLFGSALAVLGWRRKLAHKLSA